MEQKDTDQGGAVSQIRAPRPRSLQPTSSGAVETSAPSTRRTARPAENRSQSRSKAPIAILVIAALVIGFGAGALVARQRGLARDREVIMAVNGATITKDKFYGQLEAAVGPQVMNKMVTDEIMFQYAKSKGLTAGQQEVNARYEKMSKLPNFAAVLARNNQTPESFKRSLLFSMSNIKVMGQGVQATDAEVKKYYEENSKPSDPKAPYYLSETATVAVILTSDEATARKAMAELSSTNFAAVAKKYSKDKSKDIGGAIPPFPRGRTQISKIKGLEDFIFGLKIGETGGPRKFNGAWWIVRCVDKTAGRPIDFEDVEDECRDAVLLTKGKAKNQKQLQADFVEFQKKARVQAFWPKYKPIADNANKAKA